MVRLFLLRLRCSVKINKIRLRPLGEGLGYLIAKIDRVMSNDILFTERQRFKQIWIWLILFGVNGLVIYGIIQQVIIGKQFGNNPGSDTELFLVFVLVMLVTLLFHSFRLDTEIKHDGVYVRFFPFYLSFQKYSWDRIAKSFVKKYNPLLDYGGWGIRFGFPGKGKAYNVSGNKGIQLVLTDGTKLLIGTNKPDEAKQVLQQSGHLTE